MKGCGGLSAGMLSEQPDPRQLFTRDLQHLPSQAETPWLSSPWRSYLPPSPVLHLQPERPAPRAAVCRFRGLGRMRATADSRSSERPHSRRPAARGKLRGISAMSTFSPQHPTQTLTFKHLPRLLCPGQRGAVAQTGTRHGRPLASIDRPLQHRRRKTAQAQLPTDVSPRQPTWMKKSQGRCSWTCFQNAPCGRSPDGCTRATWPQVLAAPTGNLPNQTAGQVDSTRQMQQSCMPDARLDCVAMVQKVRRAH